LAILRGQYLVANPIESIKNHPIVAALLLLGAIVGSILGIVSFGEKISELIFPKPKGVPKYVGEVCDTYSENCGEGNREFMAFLGDNWRGIVELDVNLVVGAPSSYLENCPYSDVNNAIQVENKDLILLATDGATNYKLAGKFVVAEGDGGPFGWTILAQHPSN
jgi:hypothetical protein